MVDSALSCLHHSTYQINQNHEHLVLYPAGHKIKLSGINLQCNPILPGIPCIVTELGDSQKC